jgi:SNF2-related domain
MPSDDDDAEDGYGSDVPKGRARLGKHHPELLTMWTDLEKLPAIKTVRAEQPKSISRELKPFQLEGLSWMEAMEKTEWGGGLLGDEMGMGKTIQAVSLIMSDYPAKNPSLVLIPPVALMQWQQEIGDYTDGTLKTFVFHSTNKATKDITAEELKKYDVILMSYNSLESMYRHQEKDLKFKNEVHFQKSVIHQLLFHRVILDEAHNIKVCNSTICIFPLCPRNHKLLLRMVHANLNSDANHWSCQSLLRLESGSQMVFVRYTFAEPHWRILVSYQVPWYPSFRMLFLQTVSLQHI